MAWIPHQHQRVHAPKHVYALESKWATRKWVPHHVFHGFWENGSNVGKILFVLGRRGGTFVHVVSIALVATVLFSIATFSNSTSSIRSRVSRLRDGVGTGGGGVDSGGTSMGSLLGRVSSVRTRLSICGTGVASLGGRVTTGSRVVGGCRTRVSELRTRVSTTGVRVRARATTIGMACSMLGTELHSTCGTNRDSTLRMLLNSNSCTDFLAELRLLGHISRRSGRLMGNLRRRVGRLGGAGRRLSSSRRSRRRGRSRVIGRGTTVRSTHTRIGDICGALSTGRSHLRTRIGSLGSVVSDLSSRGSTCRTGVSGLRTRSVDGAANSSNGNILSDNVDFPLAYGCCISRRCNRGNRGNISVTNTGVGNRPICTTTNNAMVSTSCRSD